MALYFGNDCPGRKHAFITAKTIIIALPRTNYNMCPKKKTDKKKKTLFMSE